MTPPNKPLQLVDKPEKPLPPAPVNKDESAADVNKDDSTESKPFAVKTKRGRPKQEKICEHCEKAFATNQKLKSHLKVTL